MDSFLGKYWNNREIARRALYAAFGLNVVGTGDIYLVKPSTDDDYEEWLRMFPSSNLFTTITLAQAAVTADKGDIVAIAPGTYTEALTIGKSDARYIGLGSSPYRTVIDGDGSICATVTGLGVKFENLRFLTTGAAVVNIYGTGLVGAPIIDNCDFTQIELTSLACIQIAGATSRGLRVTNCNFLGASGSADAINAAGKQAVIMNNTAEDLNTTEATCFGVTSYHTGSNNLAV